MENKEITHCNQCPNQCPADELKCGKGRHYFEQLNNPDAGKGDEKEHHRHGDGHHKGGHQHGDGFGHNKPEDLQGLMRACGHYLHHNIGRNQDEREAAQFFAALNEEEQDCLKGLLKKLVESWWQ